MCTRIVVQTSGNIRMMGLFCQSQCWNIIIGAGRLRATLLQNGREDTRESYGGARSGGGESYWRKRFIARSGPVSAAARGARGSDGVDHVSCMVPRWKGTRCVYNDSLFSAATHTGVSIALKNAGAAADERWAASGRRSDGRQSRVSERRSLGRRRCLAMRFCIRACIWCLRCRGPAGAPRFLGRGSR